MTGFRIRCAVAALLALAWSAAAVPAAEQKLPRYESLRAETVNLRTGPGARYPVQWVYQRKGLPVEVTAEFDVWRRVKDSDGTEGWVHERMLAPRRTIVITGSERTLRNDAAPAASAVARVEPGVVARLLECRDAWCRIETHGIKGWLLESELWGVFPGEAVTE